MDQFPADAEEGRSDAELNEEAAEKVITCLKAERDDARRNAMEAELRCQQAEERAAVAERRLARAEVMVAAVAEQQRQIDDLRFQVLKLINNKQEAA